MMRFSRFGFTRFPQSSNFLFAFAQWSVVQFGFALFAAALVAVNLGYWLSPNLHPDIFLNYEAILPDAPSQMLLDFDCQFQANSNLINGKSMESAEQICRIFPNEDSLYYLISVIIEGNRVEAVTFYSSDLQYDDLIHRWGEPDATLRSENSRSFIFRWDKGSFTVAAVVSPPLGSTGVRLLELKLK